MNNNQKNYIMKISKEINKNQKSIFLNNNHSNVNIHHRSKIRNENNLNNNNHTEKEIESNIFQYEPAYQTIKPEKIKNNTYKQPPIQLSEQRLENVENRYLERQNTVSCLKPLSSYNGKVITKYNNTNSSYKDKRDIKKEKSKINCQFNAEIKSYNNINSNNKNNFTNSFIHIYSNKYSPHKIIPDEYLIQKEMYEKNIPYLSKKNFSNKNTIKKVKILSDNAKTFVEKKNHLEKKINNTNKNYSLKISTNSTEKINNKRIKKITEDKNNISSSFAQSCGNIKNYNNNNYVFHRIEISSSTHENKIKNNEENLSNKKAQNSSFKYTKTEMGQRQNNYIYKRIDNLKYNSNSNKSASSQYYYYKLFATISKFINKRKYKYWNSIKYFLMKHKMYNNEAKSYINKKLGDKRLNTIDNNTIDDCFSDKNNYLSDKIIDEIIPLRKSSNKKPLKRYRGLAIEKLNSLISSDNDNNNQQLNKKIDYLEQQIKKILKNNKKNESLNKEFGNILMKYLINKKINNNNKILTKALYDFHKKTIIIANKDKRKIDLLKKIVNIKVENNAQILRKYFYKYYYKIKCLSNIMKEKENFITCFKKEKLRNIFYKKEKNIYFILKKYFDKFYYNSILQKIVEKNFDIIENGNINIIKCNIDNDYERRKKNKLKKIIKKIKNRDNFIIKSIFKQWVLSAKIINMKIMMVREENIKKMINPLERLIKNKSNKNELIENTFLKKENLIKGIQILNNIFESYTNNKSGNGCEIKKTTEDEYNITNNENSNNINKKENLITKKYDDKIKYKCNDNWVIEEKEEEQIEENGENVEEI